MVIDSGRLALVQDFLAECYEDFDGNDIASKDNTVSTYSKRANRDKYCIMYAAKYIGAWRAVRAKLGDEERGVASIGAGPCFCIGGWFFDHPPARDQSIEAFDILKWKSVRGRETWKALFHDILGREFDYNAPFALPDGGLLPPQCSGYSGDGVSLLEPEQFADRVVLLPMLLNHLLGEDSPADEHAVLAWLTRLRELAARVVILDMVARDAPRLWASIGKLAPTEAPQIFRFSSWSIPFADAYGDEEYTFAPERRRRTGLLSKRFTTATVLVLDADKAEYL